MRKCVDFPTLPDTYYPTPPNFALMYDALTRYRADFTRVYEILALNNHHDNIPLCTSRDNGLIKIFVEKIPFEYGIRTLTMLNTFKFESVYNFLTSFYAVVEHNFHVYTLSRSFSAQFGGPLYEALRAGRTQQALQLIQRSRRDSHEPTQQQHEPELDFTDLYPPAFEDEDDPMGQHARYEPNPLLGQAPGASAYGHEDDEELFELQYNQLVQAVHGQPPEHHASQPWRPAASDGLPSRPAASKTRGCFNKVFYNECRSLGCKWAHDDDAIHRARLHFFDLLRRLVATQADPPQLQALPASQQPPRPFSSATSRRSIICLTLNSFTSTPLKPLLLALSSAAQLRLTQP
jgi:hypothetical protein